MAFMDYQRPMQVQTPNFYEAYMKGKKLRKDDELADMQLQKERNALDKENQSNALAIAYGDTKEQDVMTDSEKQQYLNAKTDEERNAVPRTLKVTKQEAEQQKQDILQRWAAIDPQGMTNTIKAYDTLDEAAQKKTVKQAEKIYTHISSVIDDKGEINKKAYNSRAADYGLPKIGDVVNGNTITADNIKQQLNQAKITVMGVKEYATKAFDLQNNQALEGTKHTNKLGEIGLENEGKQQVAEINKDADIYKADKSLEGTQYTADSSSASHKYATDKSYAGTIYTANKHANSAEKVANISSQKNEDSKDKIMYQEANKTMRDPLASEEQKQQAQAIIDQYEGRKTKDVAQGSWRKWNK